MLPEESPETKIELLESMAKDATSASLAIILSRSWKPGGCCLHGTPLNNKVSKGASLARRAASLSLYAVAGLIIASLQDTT